MTALAAQILARLAEAEGVATRAGWTGRVWFTHPDGLVEPMVADTYGSEPDAAHIAANDPAHVLRLTTALRKVVELHAEDGHGGCVTCLDYSEWGVDVMENYPCPTLAALASVWDEPGDSA